jgi:hypothetical protein
MTYGIIIIGFLLLIAAACVAQLYESWKFYNGFEIRLKKLEKKNKTISLSANLNKKVIPYVRPIGKNK